MGLGNNENRVVDDADAGDCAAGDKFAASDVACSICLDRVSDNGDRSMAKLQCGHQFHLDCIGSAFNIKGAMECPNCRKIEKGLWLYANNCHSIPEFSMDDWTHDENLYDLSYSEMGVGVNWSPFGQVAIIPSSFEEGEFPSSTFGHHAVYAEYTAASSATHPCPYIAYLGPVYPSSSNSSRSVSDGSNFNSHWNGPSVPREHSYAFPSMDFHHHSSDHHTRPFPTNGNHGGGVDQSLVPPVIQRSAGSSEIRRLGSYMHPFLVGHSPGAGVASSIAPSLIPPYPGRNAWGHDRAHARQAYYQQLQPSNTLSLRSPMISNTRRSSSHRGMAQGTPVASLSDQTNGFYFYPSSATGRNFQEPGNPHSTHFHAWERDHLHPAASGLSDFTVSSSTLARRHGLVRMSSQN